MKDIACGQLSNVMSAMESTLNEFRLRSGRVTSEMALKLGRFECPACAVNLRKVEEKHR